MNLQKIRDFVRDARGANMVEYIILVGVVAVLAMAAFKAFGTSVQTKIQEQGAVVNSVNGTS
jgi:pilus assembly protein Flp/PilA